MYAQEQIQSSGLGFPVWAAGLLTAGVSVVGGALATRFLAKGSPSQREVEAQIKLQNQMEIQRMIVEQQGTQQTLSYAVPILGGLALIMLLR